MASSGAAEAVVACCAEAGVSVDDVQAEYVAGYVEQAGEGAEDEELAEGLCCVLEAMEDLTPSCQATLVAHLRAAVAEAVEGPKGGEQKKDDDDGGGGEENENENDLVDALRALFPDASDERLAAALGRAGGDVNAAADALASRPRRRPRRASAKENEGDGGDDGGDAGRDPYYESEEYKRLRREMRDKYTFVDASAARVTHRPTVRLPGMKDKKVRYLNGVVVSTKGERTITIKDERNEQILRETVCRGLKIKTKRKGGKGYRVS